MKYIFKDVPDPNGDGFISQYLDATSKINSTNRIKLIIEHDLCAPMETWRLILYYVAVTNGTSYDKTFEQQVYHGKELTEIQRDMMVELVTEFEYFDFGDFVKNQ